MKKYIVIFWIGLLIGALIVTSGMGKAEDTNWWAKTYGGDKEDEAHAIAVALNGDIIVAGHTKSFGAGLADAWVMRLDKNGNIKWQKTYGGNKEDVANAVAIAPNGDIIIVGYTYSFGAGESDVWVLRLDEDGNIKWQRTYGGKKYDRGYAVTIASNGDIIVAGYYGGNDERDSYGERRVWVLRHDENGNIKWQKTYKTTIFFSDEAHAVAIADNGDIIIAGKWDLNAGVLRLDENGNIKWQKSYGGNEHSNAWGVALTPNGDIILVGGLEYSIDRYSIWVLKLDENGNVTWQKIYGAGPSEARGVAITDKGDIITAGYWRAAYRYTLDKAKAFILRLNEDGKSKWTKICGNNSVYYVPYTIGLTPNGDLIVAGYTDSSIIDRHDAWVLKFPQDENITSSCSPCKEVNLSGLQTGEEMREWHNTRVDIPDIQSKESNAKVQYTNTQPEIVCIHPFTSTSNTSLTKTPTNTPAISHNFSQTTTETVKSNISNSRKTTTPTITTKKTEGEGICGPGIIAIIAAIAALITRRL